MKSMRDNNQKTKRIVITIIIALLTLLTLATALVLQKTDHNSPPQKASTTTAKPKQKANIVTFTALAGKTVLEQLKTHAQNVEVKDSQFGPYVDAVNGVRGGTGGKYWAFYVNGQMASVGANDYVTKAGDKIEWRFE
jgi:hypothetical protein